MWEFILHARSSQDRTQNRSTAYNLAVSGELCGAVQKTSIQTSFYSVWNNPVMLKHTIRISESSKDEGSDA